MLGSSSLSLVTAKLKQRKSARNVTFIDDQRQAVFSEFRLRRQLRAASKTAGVRDLHSDATGSNLFSMTSVLNCASMMLGKGLIQLDLGILGVSSVVVMCHCCYGHNHRDDTHDSVK